MRNVSVVLVTFLIVFLLLSFGLAILISQKIADKKRIKNNEHTKAEKIISRMKIASPAFAHNAFIPAKYTCDGGNVSPSLSFSDIPKETKSLVLIVDDPDAPSKTWVHWTVFNINPGTTTFPEGFIPDGNIEGMTDFGKPGYGGPCPPASPRGEPSGTHRYFFKLYALDTLLTLGRSAAKQDIEEAMKGHVLEKAELIGLYKRI